jgi:hypothetical protein
MKKKHTPPPVQDRLPAMFVSDLAPAPAPLVPAEVNPAEVAAHVDRRFVVEGLEAGQWLLWIAVSLFVIWSGLDMAGVLEGPPWAAMVIIVASSLLVRLTDEHILKRRKEFRLTGEEIVAEVYRAGIKQRVIRLSWAELRAYTVVVDTDALLLRVIDHRGRTFTLYHGRAHEPARDFIWRFVEQAQRFGVTEQPLGQKAAGRPSKQDDSATQEVDPARVKAVLVALAVATFVIAPLTEWLGLPYGVQPLVIGLATCGVYRWWKLPDDDAAGRDGTSLNVFARLRRWMGRVLGSGQGYSAARLERTSARSPWRPTSATPPAT